MEVVKYAKCGDADWCIGYKCKGKAMLHEIAFVHYILTRDSTEDKWVPKGFVAHVSTKPLAKRAKAPLKGTAQSIPVHSGDHIHKFKVKWSTTKRGT